MQTQSGGLYDANVLVVALEERGMSCTWLDERKDIAQVVENWKDQLVGMIINYRTKFLGFNWGRHWTCLKKVGERYYFFNSNASAPKLLESNKEVFFTFNCHRQRCFDRLACFTILLRCCLHLTSFTKKKKNYHQ